MPARIFISHVSADKDQVARPLADALALAGHEVWFDEFSLEVGDDLRESIEAGLAECDAGVVIISPDFLDRLWTNRELSALFAREQQSKKMILPVWHQITAETLQKKAPMLAGRVAVRTADGMPTVVDRLNRAIKRRVRTIQRADLGFETYPYRLVVRVSGLDILRRLEDRFTVSAGIPTASIVRTQVMVSDDLSSVLDYDSSDSFFELKSGGRIGISNGQVMEAARTLVPDIPERYKPYGIGFPEYSLMDQSAAAYALENFSPELVLMPSLESLQHKELVPFLHAILSCTACDTGYFWGEGDLGVRTLRRFLSAGDEKLLVTAILTYPSDAPHNLLYLGWAFVKIHPNPSTPAAGAIVNAFLERGDQLPDPLVKALTTMR